MESVFSESEGGLGRILPGIVDMAMQSIFEKVKRHIEDGDDVSVVSSGMKINIVHNPYVLKEGEFFLWH